MERRHALLEIVDLRKIYGDVEAVRPLSLSIAHGDFFAILGPSGCGKSTLLMMIGGFTRPSGGRILVDGVDVTGLGPEKRPVNMVFQGYGLFSHMTVAQNIAYGLRLQKRPRDEIADRVAEMARLTRLEDLLDRGVDELSGGQRQRVALARSLIMRPSILLLDEPLAALDFKLRQQMQTELRRIHDEIGGTFIFVTHDQTEALSVANRIGVMNGGRMVQVGTPQQIYSEPTSVFVSTFIGEANLMRGHRASDRVTLDNGVAFDDRGPNGAVVCVVRPEHLHCLAPDERVDHEIAGRFVSQVFLGSHAVITVRSPDGALLKVVEPDPARAAGMIEDAATRVGWSAANHRILAEGTEA